MALGSALLPGGVFRTELSTQQVGWGLGALTGRRHGDRETAPVCDSSRQQRHGQGGRGSWYQKQSERGDLGASLTSPAVQIPSLEQPPGLFSHPAQPLPSRPWGTFPAASPLKRRNYQITNHLSFSDSISSIAVEFLHFSPPVPVPVTVITGLAGMGGGVKLQFRDQCCESCHADASVGVKSPHNLCAQGKTNDPIPLQDIPSLGHSALSLWGLCWAVGYPPDVHSFPVASLCYPAAPWRKHLGAKVMEMLLAISVQAAAMSPVCPWLGGES